VEFKDKSLRVSGKTVEEQEEVPKGSHHTITLEEGSSVGIVKEKWLKYHLKRLEQATKKQSKALMVILDREEAVFALLKSQGYDILSELKGKVKKKNVESVTTNFYQEIIEQMEEYLKRYKADRIIVASPAFWKDDLMEELKDEEIKKKIVLASCSSVGRNAIEEVLKRPELKEVLKQQRAAEEAKVVEQLMAEIGKEGLATYGKKEVDATISSGNVKTLLITDVFIYKNRSKSEEIMKSTEIVKGEVFIINSENESGQKLDSLGGIAVLLRYKAY